MGCCLEKVGAGALRRICRRLLASTSHSWRRLALPFPSWERYDKESGSEFDEAQLNRPGYRCVERRGQSCGWSTPFPEVSTLFILTCYLKKKATTARTQC
jgi:hypothetical protein